MRFDVTVYADSQDELDEALNAVRAALPVAAFNRRRSFRLEISSMVDPMDDWQDVLGDPAPVLEPESEPKPETVVLENVTAPPTTPAKSRTRKPAATPPAAVNDPAPLSEATTGETATGGDTSDPLGLDAPAVAPSGPTAEEAKEQALIALRELYAVEGGSELVKKINKEFGGVKFADLPADKGPALLERAQKARAAVEKAAA